jgi:hypothetical protein
MQRLHRLQPQTHCPSPGVASRTTHKPLRCRHTQLVETPRVSLGTIPKPLLKLLPWDRFGLSPVDFIKSAVKFVTLRVGQREYIGASAETFPQGFNEMQTFLLRHLINVDIWATHDLILPGTGMLDKLVSLDPLDSQLNDNNLEGYFR